MSNLAAPPPGLAGEATSAVIFFFGGEIWGVLKQLGDSWARLLEEREGRCGGAGLGAVPAPPARPGTGFSPHFSASSCWKWGRGAPKPGLLAT